MTTESPRLITVGSINSGATAIQADVTNFGWAAPVEVPLWTNYTLANPRPPGFPIRPSLTGAAVANSTFRGRSSRAARRSSLHAKRLRWLTPARRRSVE